jgi:pimeloyl-ACP methyl ester carboxylesterase
VIAGLAGCAQMPEPPAPQPIDEGMFVPINGLDQWVTIRGSDTHNPVILFLHGGPGAASSSSAPAYAAWEKNYTLVQWDQPSSGATYAKNIGKDNGPLTIERYRRDGIAVTEYVLKHLHKRKVILYGVSWGTILGLEMANARPDLFAGYVGVSQVGGPKGDLLGYQLALKAARDRGDAKGVKELERVGPPPYAKFEDFIVRQTYTNAPGLPPTPQEQVAIAALIKQITAPPDPNANYVAHGLPAYDGTKAFLETITAMYQQEFAWDPYKLKLSFKMPVVILNGDHDFNTPAETAMDLCHAIVAPVKHCEVIPGYGHGLVPSEITLARIDQYVRPALSRN